MEFERVTFRGWYLNGNIKAGTYTGEQYTWCPFLIQQVYVHTDTVHRVSFYTGFRHVLLCGVQAAAFATKGHASYVRSGRKFGWQRVWKRILYAMHGLGTYPVLRCL